MNTVNAHPDAALFIRAVCHEQGLYVRKSVRLKSWEVLKMADELLTM